MKIYIKDNLFNVETAGGSFVYPINSLLISFSDTDTKITLQGNSGLVVPVKNVLITEIKKESGAFYTDKADLLADLGSFFLKAPTEWGEIEGTLANQVDLQTALNAKQTADPTALDADTLTNVSVFTFWKDALKKITWANIKATLKTYFDTLYQVILVSGTNIKTVNGNDLLGAGDVVIDINNSYTTKAVFAPTAPTDGVIVAIDDNNFSVAGATYTIDEFAGDVCEIKRDGITQYCIIASNTADTITLAQIMVWSAINGDLFSILNTHYVNPVVSAFPQIYGLYPVNFSGAVVVPEILEPLERLVIDCYIESLANGNKIIIIAQGTQGFFSNQFRWIKLEEDKESFRLVGHFFAPNLHWDVINTGNIKRFATAYFNDFLLAAEITPQFITNFNTDKLIRFETAILAGITWLEYSDLIPKDFLASFTAEIEKAGGGGAGEVTIQWHKYTYTTGITAPLTYQATTRFAAGDGVQTITLQQPVTLAYRDRIAVTITREAGTITLREFSNINILEF